MIDGKQASFYQKKNSVSLYYINTLKRQGKALEGDLGNFWRYRVGKYRIIADIKNDRFLVTVLKTDKRNDVYKK